jgi:hypothetical protein
MRVLHPLKPLPVIIFQGHWTLPWNPSRRRTPYLSREKETSGFPKTPACRKAFSSIAGILLNPFSVVQQAHWVLCNNYSFIIWYDFN